MAEPLGSVGRYELLEVIGRGGAAVVYLAHQPDLDRQVALKELAAHHAADPSFAQRFVEESRLAAAMNHPSIVTVFEYFEHDGLPYIAMEYMSQGSLRGHLQRLSGAQLGGVLESVLEGLSYAERLGIIHRDLKPENLLVGVNGEVKIADFGVARALSSTTVRPYTTIAGTPIGTPAYMAPEQAMAKPLTHAADLYSVGIIAWEALAGRTPFGSADTPMAVLYQQVHEPIPPIETIRDDVHPGASQWLSRMLAKRPEDRFGTAREAWDELEEVLIDMLGPRWRRDAALIGLEQEERDLQTPNDVDPFAGAHRPQPAGFNIDGLDADRPGSGSGESGPDGPAEHDRDEEDLRWDDEPARPQVSAVLTPDPSHTPSGRRPSLDPFVPLTPLPAQEPVADDLYSFRTAAATATSQRRSRSRSNGRLAGAAVLIVVTAAAGGVIGSMSSKSGRAAAKPAQTRTTAGDLDTLAVRRALDDLAPASKRAITHFDAAKTSKTQAAAALAVSKLYTGMHTKLAALPSAEQAQPGLAAVEKDLTVLAKDWRGVSADAQHGLRKAYKAAASTVKHDETRLADDAATAES